MLISFENPPFKEMCYLVANSDKDCFIIDPGGRSDEIISHIDTNYLNLRGILFTHAHCDHVAGALPIFEKYAVGMYMHKDETTILEKSNFFWMFVAGSLPFLGPSNSQMRFFSLNFFSIPGFDFNIFHTPGHSPGSCIINYDNYFFTGDTIMKEYIGRSDLFGGNRLDLACSIKSLPDFPNDTIFLPGHGSPFTKTELLKHNLDYKKYKNESI